MRLLLLADVHANREALEAVLGHAGDWPEAVLVAGDLVGLGPDPDAVVARLVACGARCVMGNHDAMVLGELPLRRCSNEARRGAAWTRRTISPDTRGYLASLPRSLDAGDGTLVCHAHPGDLERRVTTAPQVDEALSAAGALCPHLRVLVCGHEHGPAALTALRAIEASNQATVYLDPGERWLVRPGAVGQSRDEALVARYARLDTSACTVAFFEVPYDDAATASKLAAAGLRTALRARPRSRLSRLSAGARALLRAGRA